MEKVQKMTKKDWEDVKPDSVGLLFQACPAIIHLGIPSPEFSSGHTKERLKR